MLSRTAEGLFWMGRFIERMENVARLLDAGRRLDSLPQATSDRSTEWSSIIVASGASGTFPLPLEEANVETVSHHLIRDLDNPSSIISCVEAARMNAKAVRNAISAEVWEAINDTRAELRSRLEKGEDQDHLVDFLDWIRMRGGLAQGKIDNTLLLDASVEFVTLGKWFERADATARLLDVKYHVLLPEATDVGGGLDYLQWVQILRAANSAVAFRYLYSRIVDPKGVVDLLVLNKKSPRSLLTSLKGIRCALEDLASELPVQQQLVADARAAEQRLKDTEVDEIFNHGLHDWLTNFIVATNQMAGQTSSAFGFGAEPVLVMDEVSQ